MQCKEKKKKQKNGWRQVGLLELIKEAAKKRKKISKIQLREETLL